MDCGRPRPSCQEKARREENFPIELVQKALGIDIVEAKASRAVDKLRILNCIQAQLLLALCFANPDKTPAEMLQESWFVLDRCPATSKDMVGMIPMVPRLASSSVGLESTSSRA